jgi:hypothetical protein
VGQAFPDADRTGAYRLTINGNKITFVRRDGADPEKLIGNIDLWMLDVSKRMRHKSEEVDRRKAELTAGLRDREHCEIELHEKYKNL